MQIIITIEDGQTPDVSIVQDEAHAKLKALGEEIRRRRTDLRLTQTELAELSGVHQNTISVFERGKINSHPSTLELIENALTAAETKNKGENK